MEHAKKRRDLKVFETTTRISGMSEGTIIFDEWHFDQENILGVNAACIGISRRSWKSIAADCAQTEAARTLMQQGPFDVLPIISGEQVSGYYQTETWGDFSSVTRKTMGYKDIIPLQTHVRDLIKGLATENRSFFFLSNENRIAGIVTIADLNSRPVRVYLFSLLSEMEIRLGKLLLAHMKEDQFLNLECNTEKLEEAKTRLKDDRVSGVETSFVNYLYLSDLVNVIAAKGINEKLNYSRTQFERLGSLNELRHATVHANRSIIDRNNGVDRLWKRIDRIEDALFRLRQVPALQQTVFLVRIPQKYPIFLLCISSLFN